MQLYLVIMEYSDLNLFSADYLDGIMDKLGKSVKLTSTTYLVKSEASVVDLRTSILEKDSDISRIFVTACSAPSAWRGMYGTSEDIKALLRDDE